MPVVEQQYAAMRQSPTWLDGMAQQYAEVLMGFRSPLSGVLTGAGAGMTMIAASVASAQVGKPPLTMVSWGGAFTKSQMIAYVEPYRQLRDRWVEVLDYEGGLDAIRDQVYSANVKWDLVSLELPDAIAGCQEGLLERIDHHLGQHRDPLFRPFSIADDELAVGKVKILNP